MASDVMAASFGIAAQVTNVAQGPAVTRYEVHPDSGAPIKGVKIPGWQELKKDMLELANKLPYMNFIAWDILITPEGHCIIEANTSSGVNIIQLWGGQRHGELGDFYRAHNVKC